jgi:hypothetical protein
LIVPSALPPFRQPWRLSEARIVADESGEIAGDIGVLRKSAGVTRSTP